MKVSITLTCNSPASSADGTKPNADCAGTGLQLHFPSSHAPQLAAAGPSTTPIRGWLVGMCNCQS
eukprot:5633953-Amphidinium_carterae.1